MYQPRTANVILQLISRSNERDNIRVGNVDLSELQVFPDGKRQLREC